MILQIVIFLAIVYLILFFIVRPLAQKRFAPPLTMKTPTANPKFDKNFKFGGSTSAWQVEDIKEKSNWSLFEEKKKPNGTPCCPPHKHACESIERFDSDLQLMKDLKFTSYRFSVSWTAVNPEKGKFNLEYLQNYVTMCKKLRESGIEPMLTLWHFENPAWVELEGGVLGPHFKEYLTEFTTKVIEAVKDCCTWFITINEPVVFANLAYKDGVFPPGEKSLTKFFACCSSFMECHVQMYKIIHNLIPDAKVSIAKHTIPFYPMHNWSVLESIVCNILNNFNTSILDAFETEIINYNVVGIPIYKKKIEGLKDTLDFIGINHYYCTWVSINPKDWDSMVFLPPPMSQNLSNYDHSDFGWSLCPESLAISAKWIHQGWNKRNLPIVITEHGIADEKDTKRPWFLEQSLSLLNDTIKEEKVPVIGYSHWSFLDNYEWAEGYKMRFGIVEVNHDTQERKIRESALLYKKIIENSK
ncbi:Glycosyl hydrolase family 1 protein [Trichomonas vaginalis G3]|uniref:Glycosyl hydrolase family 1 protein n=1 Tax=Trichomonas vaginalis (strain ATCC PRA-98 / G3) TaxID=412133 RepID=A2FGP1_TRIV3|nr:glycosyl hydrolase [Trichomonas vaginalis G3]EAX95923.1 Glycosyl hydrolase family 1 protein [Trichomonas vaginalis G3]KAI5540146.1 beta-glucosidase protein [Trichomonas vaginalis G3]|eukprot:XP_001308853.1 glycosyl hydrolase [Trichomonas vaginalis G3]